MPDVLASQLSVVVLTGHHMAVICRKTACSYHHQASAATHCPFSYFFQQCRPPSQSLPAVPASQFIASLPRLQVLITHTNGTDIAAALVGKVWPAIPSQYQPKELLVAVYSANIAISASSIQRAFLLQSAHKPSFTKCTSRRRTGRAAVLPHA